MKVKKQPKDKKKFTDKVEDAKKRQINKLKEAQSPTKTSLEQSAQNKAQTNPTLQDSEIEPKSNESKA